MSEFFITARSFAAPFCSDTSEAYVEDTCGPAVALETFARDYKHSCGLYAAEAWASADAFHKNETPLARYESNQLQTINFHTRHKSAYTLGPAEGGFELDGKSIPVENPREGSVVA